MSAHPQVLQNGNVVHQGECIEHVELGLVRDDNCVSDQCMHALFELLLLLVAALESGIRGVIV